MKRNIYKKQLIKSPDLSNDDYKTVKIKMDKKIALVIMLVVIGVQAIHFGYSYKYYNYSNKVDDSTNISYGYYKSQTTDAKYAIAFYIIAAAFSALAYGVCIIANMGNIYLHHKLVYHINLLVFFCQFTLATLFAIEVSSKISPNSPNATSMQTETNYQDTYWLALADAVITWVLCVPGSFVLTFLNEKEASSSPVEQKSGTIA